MEESYWEEAKKIKVKTGIDGITESEYVKIYQRELHKKSLTASYRRWKGTQKMCRHTC